MRIGISFASRISRCVAAIAPYRRLQWIVGRGAAIPTQTIASERSSLYDYAQYVLLSPGSTGRFLEVGSYLGGSSVVLAEALRRRLGTRGVLHCVDTWANHAMSEGERDTWLDFSNNTFNWKQLVLAFRSLSHEASLPDGEPYDLAFIDGDHTYEGCRSDIDRFGPKVRNGGLLVMHDHSWYPGVAKVVGELLESGDWLVHSAVDNIIALRRDEEFRRRRSAVSSPSAYAGVAGAGSLDTMPYFSVDVGNLTSRHSPTQDLILTTYFTGTRDPQGNRSVPPDDPARLEPWTAGIVALGLSGIIFHDGLSTEFAERHSSEHVSFVKVASPGWLSANDYRFFVWKSFLERFPCRNVFFTDLFDVVVNRSPFTIFDDQHHLWVSKELGLIGDNSAPSLWLESKLMALYQTMPERLHGVPILNAGVWGGPYGHSLRALCLLCNELSSLGSNLPFNSNMAVFNKVMHVDIGGRLLWCHGAPLHSEFRSYESNADVCFVHK